MSSDNLNNLSIPQHISTKTIFKICKYKRDGLLDKEHAKSEYISKNVGKWTKEEHQKFIRACLKHGKQWQMIKSELPNRTCAQIRSHAQKCFIRVCKKYNIEIKSKRKESFNLQHMIFPYKTKFKSKVPLYNMSRTERELLKIFDFYTKKINLEEIPAKNETIFKIEKIPRQVNEVNMLDNKLDEISNNCNDKLLILNNSNLELNHHECIYNNSESQNLKGINFLLFNCILNNLILINLSENGFGIDDCNITILIIYLLFLISEIDNQISGRP